MLSVRLIPYIIVAIIFSYNPPWPIFGFSSEIGMMLSLLLLLGIKKKKSHPLFPKHYFSLILLVIFFIITHLFSGLSYSYFIYISIFYYCYKYLSDEDGRRVILWTTRILSVVLGISLVAWLIHNNLLTFPCWEYIDISEGKGAETIMGNYLFFVQNENALGLVNRFYSIFDEPGVVGTLSAFILFANKYDFKNNKQLIVIMFAAFFTFSLAFYVLTIIGYTYFLLKDRKINFLKLVFISIILLVFIAFVVQTEEFNLIIKYRFEEGLGSSLENRTADNINEFYEKEMWSMDWLIGLGKSGMLTKGLLEGSSYKVFVLREGFFALLSLIFAYYSMIRKRSLNIIAFFILFWLSFLQRPSAMNAGFIMIFATCIAYLRSNVYTANQ